MQRGLLTDLPRTYGAGKMISIPEMAGRVEEQEPVGEGARPASTPATASPHRRRRGRHGWSTRATYAWWSVRSFDLQHDGKHLCEVPIVYNAARLGGELEVPNRAVGVRRSEST